MQIFTALKRFLLLLHPSLSLPHLRVESCPLLMSRHIAAVPVERSRRAAGRLGARLRTAPGGGSSPGWSHIWRLHCSTKSTKRHVKVKLCNPLIKGDILSLSYTYMWKQRDIHRFLGVLSPSACSMRLCLQALRMSTTFTELIFASSSCLSAESQNWTEEVARCCALNTNSRR